MAPPKTYLIAVQLYRNIISIIQGCNCFPLRFYLLSLKICVVKTVLETGKCRRKQLFEFYLEEYCWSLVHTREEKSEYLCCLSLNK